MTETTAASRAANASADPTFRKSAEVVARKIAGEYLLVPVKGRLADLQRIFTLNPVAERIWEALDGTTSAAALCRLVTASFETRDADVSEEVRSFLGQLLEAGLIEQA